MAEGKDRFLGAVPLKGDSEIFQRDAAVDILTITGVAGQTGDFLVLQNSGGTERFVVDKDGDITLGGDLTITGSFAVTGSSVFTGAITQSGGAVLVKGAAQFNQGITISTGAGDLVLKKNATHAAATPFSRLNLAMLHTAPTSAAGCTTGDLFLFHVTTDVWRLAMCVSGAATTFARIRRASFDVTLGSAS
jgi:hypothetical protein